MGCRTRVIGNEYDPTREIVTGRGNLSFTSINLPRLAIKANGDIDKFFTLLNNMMDLTIEQLTDRFAIQCQKKVRNYPFLMGQGVWLDSEGLGPDDSVAEVLKHGTLSVGFIGLAETLKALIGKHHGESAEAQELGLKIIQTMRDRTDLESKKTGLNFSVLATPAEGLSGRFVPDGSGTVWCDSGRNGSGLLHQLIPCSGLLSDSGSGQDSSGSSVSRPYKRRTYQLCRNGRRP